MRILSIQFHRFSMVSSKFYGVNSVLWCPHFSMGQQCSMVSTLFYGVNNVPWCPHCSMVTTLFYGVNMFLWGQQYSMVLTLFYGVHISLWGNSVPWCQNCSMVSTCFYGATVFYGVDIVLWCQQCSMASTCLAGDIFQLESVYQHYSEFFHFARVSSSIVQQSEVFQNIVLLKVSHSCSYPRHACDGRRWCISTST